MAGGAAAGETVEFRRATSSSARATPVVLRIVADQLTDHQLLELTGVVDDIHLPMEQSSTSDVGEYGWLVWTVDGLRRVFRHALETERRMTASLSRLNGIQLRNARIRWGIWTDQYVLPFGQHGHPAIPDVTTRAIFNFEPDNLLSSSDPVYQTNRRWEHFVCVPRRLLGRKTEFGFRLTGRERPSALDHASRFDSSRCPLIGRDNELSLLENYYQRSERSTFRLALVAEAGSGKTRLIKEWLRQHGDRRVLSANFSLFGGEVISLASQLAELPADRLSDNALLAAVVTRVESEAIGVLVFDDLHWADSDGIMFVRSLLDAVSQQKIFVLLSSRPSGRSVLDALAPAAELAMRPLPTPAATELARQIIGTEAVAAIAAERSKEIRYSSSNLPHGRQRRTTKVEQAVRTVSIK